MEGLITCFRCRGEGIIYRYEGELGTRKTCPGCFGRGSLIANSCIQCTKCRGKGQVYEYDDDLGQRYECPLCKNTGYTIERYLECPKCKGGGRIYPFQEEKLGVPKGCIPCGATGYIKERDYYNINFNQNNYYYNKPIDPREAAKLIPWKIEIWYGKECLLKRNILLVKIIFMEMIDKEVILIVLNLLIIKHLHNIQIIIIIIIIIITIIIIIIIIIITIICYLYYSVSSPFYKKTTC